MAHSFMQRQITCTLTEPTQNIENIPVRHKPLVLAEVTEEACVVQMHDGMLLSSNVYIHREPVIHQVALKRPEGEDHI